MSAYTAAPLLAQVGCTQSEGGAFECLNDGDCPPECPCDNNPALGDLVGACESKKTGRDCGGSCDAETQCSAGTSCVFDRTDGEVDFYSCKGDGTGGAGGMAGTGGSGGTGGATGCASASGELAIALNWTGGGDLDLGMQTPDGSVAPGFEGEPGADPNCAHGGNDTGMLGQETMTCPNPLTTGPYTVHVDSEADEEIMFTLTITVGGQHVSSLEFGIPPLQAGTSPVMSSIPARSFQEWVTDFCLE